VDGKDDTAAGLSPSSKGAAHDLNNLLATILGCAELVLLRLEAGSPVRRDLEEIRSAAERAAGLVRALNGSRGAPAAGRGASFPAATVLLVEDEEIVRRLAAHFLEEAGYRVREAADGPSALALLRDPTAGIELMVTDVRLPGMDGKDLVDAVRQVKPSLPILLVSGALAPDGADGASFLAKPYSPEQLLERVRSILRR
jgi:CheY-like chemotaxis protein